jgi:probable F420-dependent oxidoreductase
MADAPPRRPFRFGVQAGRASSRAEWVELARRVERLGFSHLALPDHFDEQLAPVPALMAAADATEHLRVGALVWDNDYRHPLVLAKELATMDVLSEGRVDIGLGAGWMRSDYDQSGLRYDPPGVRIDRFVEAVAVMKGVLSGEPFSFTGRHYTITNHTGFPLPVQRPHPPFMIGGGGRRMLTVAAREADVVSVNPTLTSGVMDTAALATASAAAVDEKVALVRAAAGARLATLELEVRPYLVEITNERLARADAIAQLMGQPADEVLATPFALIGTERQIIEDLCARRERWGFSYIAVSPGDIDGFAPIVAELAGT